MKQKNNSDYALSRFGFFWNNIIQRVKEEKRIYGFYWEKIEKGRIRV